MNELRIMGVKGSRIEELIDDMERGYGKAEVKILEKSLSDLCFELEYYTESESYEELYYEIYDLVEEVDQNLCRIARGASMGYIAPYFYTVSDMVHLLIETASKINQIIVKLNLDSKLEVELNYDTAYDISKFSFGELKSRLAANIMDIPLLEVNEGLNELLGLLLEYEYEDEDEDEEEAEGREEQK